MSNHLKDQTSPYLLQHAENPVDWFPWCEEAFEKAEKEDKPVFLSIGYSTCHWCHVMAHESFENKEIADILNRYFVSVKVDREERPDVDSVYMSVCQALTGGGGWPMSIFMTADQKPFYAGTYFPPVSHRGMPGFKDLLLIIADRWKNRRADLLKSADYILAHINIEDGGLSEKISPYLVDKAAEIFAGSFDKRFGGFGDAPKFPMPHNLIFLTLYSEIRKDSEAFDEVRITLEKMRRGGIFDQIGFGFSRYSTDKYYLVPHFEKMLYDNALLILAYSAAYKVSGDEMLLDTAEKTAEYILREMTDSAGGFYSAQDADSEGEEGKFYVWDYGEICSVLGSEKGESFCRYFGITRQGIFEGKNIPNLLQGNAVLDDFSEEKKLLYDYRKKRARLHLDDKILTSWNALMICAMSVLYRVTGKERYLTAAEAVAEFIEKNLAEGSVLYVSDRQGTRSVRGFLDEYAYYAAAMISLYEATSRELYLHRAKELMGEAEQQFGDHNRGGYFLYGTKNSSLISRPKETYDGAMPSGNSVMAYCLVRMSQLTGEENDIQAAEKQLAFMTAQAEAYPAGYGMFLTALLFYFYPPQKITAVLQKEDKKEEIAAGLPLYADIRILESETEDYKLLHNKTTYYVCKNNTCLPPSNQKPVF
ncbi:MAG: thioredoxin domain-containing protein [Eubacteriales bacterium]|nr:thioredoxin domain-containing protein [Eubacteriales bacterium]